jgi:cation transport ATPase
VDTIFALAPGVCVLVAQGLNGNVSALAMTGHAIPWSAMFADFAARMLAVLNGLRLLRWRAGT